MARDDHPFPPFPWSTLERPLSSGARDALARSLRGLLRFQKDLTPPRPVRSPDGAPRATPFVSVYGARGELRGCYGDSEGGPMERVTRAFLRAVHDTRFGGIAADERPVLTAQLSYPRRARLLNPESAAGTIEAGTHGVAFVPDRGPTALLLPHVARDERLGPDGMLDALARKAGIDRQNLSGGALYVFETQDVVVRPDPRDRRGEGRMRSERRALDAAGAWLSSLVGDTGSVAFAIDPRARRQVAIGEMHHGRAAAVVQALGAIDAAGALLSRARRRLERDIREALAGRATEGWPSDPERVAATLALAIRAGLPLQGDLTALLRAQPAMRTPWHAAQVVAALGPMAPPEAWSLCVADLDRRPFAPWTVIAAGALGDATVAARAARLLAPVLRSEEPDLGGAGTASPPEVALTALAVEALAPHRTVAARAAVERGRAFLMRTQLVDDRVYAALDPALAWGAFPATPTVDVLRGDVSAHAVLAILAARHERDR